MEEETTGEGDDDSGAVIPLEDGLVTLSTLPKSHWSNLLNLDIIKVRVFLIESRILRVKLKPSRKEVILCVQ